MSARRHLDSPEVLGLGLAVARKAIFRAA